MSETGLYISEYWRVNQDDWRMALRERKALFVMTGMPQVGKSTFASLLVESIQEESPVLWIHASIDTEPTQLLQTIARYFDFTRLRLKNLSLTEQVRAQCIAVRHSDHDHRVFIDDAHLLSSEVLEVLLAFTKYQIQEAAFLQFVLVGDDKFSEKLDEASAQAWDASVVKKSVPTLSKPEVRTYLETTFPELKASGLVIKQRLLDRIHRTTQGCFGKLQALLACGWIQQNLERKFYWQNPTFKKSLRVLGAAVASVVFMGGAYLFSYSMHQPSKVHGIKKVSSVQSLSQEPKIPSVNSSSAQHAPPAPKSQVTVSQTKRIQPKAQVFPARTILQTPPPSLLLVKQKPIVLFPNMTDSTDDLLLMRPASELVAAQKHQDVLSNPTHNKSKNRHSRQ